MATDGFKQSRSTASLSRDPEEHSSAQRPISFLDLPAGVRRQVYISAGLVRDCPIELGNAPVGCYCDKEHLYAPPSLLFVSRGVSSEVSEILYKENIFKIHCLLYREGSNSLRTLRLSLGPLRKIRYLSIVLYKDYRLPIEEELGKWSHAQGHSRTLADPRLLDTNVDPDGHTHMVFRAWCNLVKSLSTVVDPGNLRLQLWCYFANKETIKHFLAPLKQISPLKELALRVEDRCCAQVPSVQVQDFVWPLVQMSPSFRLMDLPAHLHEIVLAQSGLVHEFHVAFDFSGLMGSVDRAVECCGNCSPPRCDMCFCPDQFTCSTSCSCDRAYWSVMGVQVCTIPHIDVRVLNNARPCQMLL